MLQRISLVRRKSVLSYEETSILTNSEAMKDVVACEKLWGVGKQTVIQRSLNGGTHPAQAGYLVLNP